MAELSLKEAQELAIELAALANQQAEALQVVSDVLNVSRAG